MLKLEHTQTQDKLSKQKHVHDGYFSPERVTQVRKCMIFTVLSSHF